MKWVCRDSLQTSFYYAEKLISLFLRLLVLFSLPILAHICLWYLTFFDHLRGQLIFFFLNEAVEFFLSPMWFDKYVNSVGKYPISSAGERLLISFSTGELTGWAWGLSWLSPSLQEWYQGIGWLGCLTFLTPSRQFLFSSYMFCVSELLVISDTEAETPDPLFLS